MELKVCCGEDEIDIVLLTSSANTSCSSDEVMSHTLYDQTSMSHVFMGMMSQLFDGALKQCLRSVRKGFFWSPKSRDGFLLFQIWSKIGINPSQSRYKGDREREKNDR